METITLTKDQLESIILKAFKAGEDWGTCYASWFTPTEEQTQEKIQETIKKLIS